MDVTLVVLRPVLLEDCKDLDYRMSVQALAASTFSLKVVSMLLGADLAWARTDERTFATDGRECPGEGPNDR